MKDRILRLVGLKPNEVDAKVGWFFLAIIATGLLVAISGGDIFHAAKQITVWVCAHLA